MRSSLDPHVSVSIISDRQRLKSILYITMMCEIMHQTRVASHGDLPSLHHFVTVKGDRFVGSRAFSRMAFLLCMQRTSHRNSGEPYQVAEILEPGVPIRVFLHDCAVVEVHPVVSWKSDLPLQAASLQLQSCGPLLSSFAGWR